MIRAADFQVDDTHLRFKKDTYPLAQVRDVRVKANNFSDHLIRVLAIGLLISSVVWMICPGGFGWITGPVALFIGILAAITTVRRYELQIEFQHTDDTGLQWVSMAKGNRRAVLAVFEQQAAAISHKLEQLRG